MNEAKNVLHVFKLTWPVALENKQRKEKRKLADRERRLISQSPLENAKTKS
jgi:hypothetical protein